MLLTIASSVHGNSDDRKKKATCDLIETVRHMTTDDCVNEPRFIHGGFFFYSIYKRRIFFSPAMVKYHVRRLLNTGYSFSCMQSIYSTHIHITIDTHCYCRHEECILTTKRKKNRKKNIYTIAMMAR